MITLAEAVRGLRLVDHHVHGAFAGPLDADGFAAGLSESDRPPAPGTSFLDTPLGFAVRRWCAPVLDLPAHASGPDYLARRAELGVAEVNRRFLTGAGVDTWLVDTGYRSGELVTPDGAREIVRLEAVASDVAEQDPGAAGFATAFADALTARIRGAAGLKSVIAYRFGLEVPGRPPSPAAVTAAAGRWLRAGGRLTEPDVLHHLLWVGAATGLPLQFHVGYGDPDLTLHRTDPSLLTPFLRAVRTPVMLLHCWPYHRSAAYLTAVFPHVHLDVGLALNHVGARAAAVLAEALEVAPFGKVLYSSDAFGPAELHWLGAQRWRAAVVTVLGGFVAAGEWCEADARRVATLMGRGNAERVYDLSCR